MQAKMATEDGDGTGPLQNKLRKQIQDNLIESESTDRLLEKAAGRIETTEDLVIYWREKYISLKDAIKALAEIE